ncbi:amidase [Burkholderia sp. BCC0405]|uniref:amidase n=1 Tax=Burkholderia sp. BCC0405 TaxID=2676298 RepID=UPI001ABB5583|nr:amidase [Burkholderia sp. BCC0405]
MISFDEYRGHDAVGLARLVASGELQASELLDAAISRADEVNGKLNAIVTPMHALARERAQGKRHGPLAGVPFLLKDLRQDYAGVVTTNGCKALKAGGRKAQAHSSITARWLDAGLVVMGKTNTSEFGAKGTTEPDAWGPTRNPWDTTLSAGGSSGGACAAVSAGIVPVAGASDAGGSIRIPASYCGLFGLKPGRGRTPMGPAVAEIMHGAAAQHVVSRSVRDSAACLDATHGHEPNSPFRIAAPERPYRDEIERDCEPLRIALSHRSSVTSFVDAEAVRAVEQAGELLQTLGHHVEWAEPHIDGAQMGRDFTNIWFAYCASMVRQIKRELGADDTGFEPDTLIMAAFGRAMPATDYVESYMRLNEYSRALGEFHQRYDVLITPTVAMQAPRIGELATPRSQQRLLKALDMLGLTRAVLHSAIVRRVVLKNLARVPYTQLANLTGVPSMSVPLHWGDDQLPWGVQFVASHGTEGMLFRLAAQLERAKPWFDRVPVL